MLLVVLFLEIDSVSFCFLRSVCGSFSSELLHTFDILLLFILFPCNPPPSMFLLAWLVLMRDMYSNRISDKVPKKFLVRSLNPCCFYIGMFVLTKRTIFSGMIQTNTASVRFFLPSALISSNLECDWPVEVTRLYCMLLHICLTHCK